MPEATIVYTIGFAGKTAAQFFGALRRVEVKQVLDVRLNNVSQLAGFTKRQDLPFFLREICGVGYLHEPLLAPTKDILDTYRKDHSWTRYTERHWLQANNIHLEDDPTWDGSIPISEHRTPRLP